MFGIREMLGKYKKANEEKKAKKEKEAKEREIMRKRIEKRILLEKSKIEKERKEKEKELEMVKLECDRINGLIIQYSNGNGNNQNMNIKMSQEQINNCVNNKLCLKKNIHDLKSKENTLVIILKKIRENDKYVRCEIQEEGIFVICNFHGIIITDFIPFPEI